MPYLTFSALPTDKTPSEGSEPGNDSKLEKTVAPENRSAKSNEPSTASCLDKKLMEAYKGRVVHGSRTLDQYYYWSLTDEETKRRDNDQVVTRYLKEKKWAKSKLLRIDMLWL